jgi:hypothetical protein
MISSAAAANRSFHLLHFEELMGFSSGYTIRNFSNNLPVFFHY